MFLYPLCVKNGDFFVLFPGSGWVMFRVRDRLRIRVKVRVMVRIRVRVRASHSSYSRMVLFPVPTTS